MLLDVKLLFENHLRERFKDSEELRNFVLNHERKEFVLNKICHQVLLCENKAILKRKKTPKYIMDAIVKSIANGFADLCIKHRDESNISSVERLNRESESTKWKDAQAEMDDEVKHIELQVNK